MLESIASAFSFTSGSTGNPKVVGITHGNLLGLVNGAEFYTHVIKPGFMFYGFLPLYHIYGVVINIIVPVSMQCKLLLQPVLKPQEFVKDWQQYMPSVSDAANGPLWGISCASPQSTTNHQSKRQA